MAAPSPTHGCQGYGQKFDTIPVLDLSRFGEGNELNDECLKVLAEACELGCFRVINHGIPDDLIKNADKACRQVFQLPRETKMKNISPNPYGGYLADLPPDCFYESLGIVGVPNPQTIQDFSNLMCPKGNQQFCEIIKEYTSKMLEVSRRIHEILLASWGVGKYYESHFGHGNTLFRMNMYDVESEIASEALGLRPHTDTTSLSLLHQDESGSLQVQNKAGNWVAVKSIPNTIVVFAGDSFQAWSNGRIRSVKHRVTVKEQLSRLSMGVFCTFPDEMEIQTPDELVDDGHPRRYRAFRYGELIDSRRAGEGKTGKDHLQVFALVTNIHNCH